jgi:hypothetical protein
MNKSLAGTGARYVPIQVRVDGSRLHIQGKHESVHVNRAYGVAVNVTAVPELVSWISQQPHPLPSLAGTHQKYVPVQARVYHDDGVVHVQVSGSPLNRTYGAAFNIVDDVLLEFVSEAEDAPIADTGPGVYQATLA